MSQSGQRNREFEFTPHDFARVRELIYHRAGISLSEIKSDMVYNRLGRNVRRAGHRTFKAYLDFIEEANNALEWEAFTNALTTNLTAFFREAHHFPILAEHMLALQPGIKIWCAASSTGEEAYSIAMTACEIFGTLKPQVEILATDIDTRVLSVAKRGVFPISSVANLSDERRTNFFLRGKGGCEGSVKVCNALRKMVTFKQMNLLSLNLPVEGQFDAIFCRNVMIYFDNPTRSTILEGFRPLLKKSGLLFVGHSENLNYVSNAFKLRGNTVYELNDGQSTAARGKQ